MRQLREKGRVVEPLKDFHKDEVCLILFDVLSISIISKVRAIGRELGLPTELTNRHPFPWLSEV